MVWAIGVNRPYLGRCALDAWHAVALRRWVGRSAFLLIQRHEFHPAFRTISRMIGNDFGMHQAGVLLFIPFFLLVLLLVIDLVIAVGVLRDHRIARHEHKCARD